MAMAALPHEDASASTSFEASAATLRPIDLEMDISAQMSPDQLYAGIYSIDHGAHPDANNSSLFECDSYDTLNDPMNMSFASNTTVDSQFEFLRGKTSKNEELRYKLQQIGINPDDDSPECGLGKCRPRCIQPCSSIYIFLPVICVLATLSGSLSSGYLASVLTTIEKRFEIGSSTSGVIAASYEFGSLVAVIFVSYLGSRRHIPKWLGYGVFLMGAGSLMFVLPHLVAEKYTIHRGFFNNVTEENVCHSSKGNKDDVSESFCVSDTSGNGLYVFILILSQMMIGIGGTPIFTLGTTYIDNHVTKQKAPALIAFVYASASLGPVVGFGLGALMLQYYVDLFSYDYKILDITSVDSRWVGAWWAGFVVIGGCLLMVSLPFFCFPKVLRREKQKLFIEEEKEKDESMTHSNVNEDKNYGKSAKDIPKSIWRLLKNPVYMLTCFGVCCEISIVTGFITFLPKYLETQFSLGKSEANLFTGGIAVPGAVIGIIAGGYILKKRKLKSKGAISLTLIFNFIAIFGFAAVFFLGCENLEIAGATKYYNGSGHPLDRNLTSTCNSDCDCSSNDIELVCGADDITYFSPCHAGCTSYYADNTSLSNYTNCACIVGVQPDVVMQPVAVAGPCDNTCSSLLPFMVVLFFMCMVVAGTQTPLLMITMRSVNEEERSFCLGMQFVILRLFAYIPGPIVFGNIIDQTCRFWKTQCNENGACLLYDIEKFRYYYMGTALGLKVLGICFFIIVWFVLKCKNYNEPTILQESVDGSHTSTDHISSVSDTYRQHSSSVSYSQQSGELAMDSAYPDDTWTNQHPGSKYITEVHIPNSESMSSLTYESAL